MRNTALGIIGAAAGRKLAIALTVVCVLASGLVAAPTPAAGQSDAGIRIYGNSPPDHFPSLHGPADGWWRVEDPSGQYGLDHHGPYAYTYGNQDAVRTNWATWDFEVTDSNIYDVWVWVPAEHATAQVNYGLHLSGCSHRLGVYPTLDQQEYTGWVKIGRAALDRIHNSPSNRLVLEVNDNDVGDPNDSLPHRSIGVSVALLERNYNMGWERQDNSNELITDQGCFGASQTIEPRVDLSEPRNVRVVAGDGSLVVSWDEPARTVGLIDYDVAHRCAGSTKWTEWRPEDVSTRWSATITGLVNGVECRVRVWAHNDGLNAQSGGYAYASGSPQAARRMVRISWGSNATGRPHCADADRLCRNLSYVLSGFGAGPYWLSCFEKGSSTPGWSGSWSGPSTAHRACYFGRGDGEVWVSVDGVESNRLQAPSATVPGMPRDVRVDPGDGDLVVSWLPPAYDGGKPVTRYRVTWNDGDAGRTRTQLVGANARSYTIRELADGTSYTVTVTAVNREGRGRTASATARTTGARAHCSSPDAPGLSVSIVDAGVWVIGSLLASWIPPEDQGDSRVTGYEVVISGPGATFGPYKKAATDRNHRYRYPRDNATYTVQVFAKNRCGVSAPTTVAINTGIQRIMSQIDQLVVDVFFEAVHGAKRVELLEEKINGTYAGFASARALTRDASKAASRAERDVEKMDEAKRTLIRRLATILGYANQAQWPFESVERWVRDDANRLRIEIEEWGGPNPLYRTPVELRTYNRQVLAALDLALESAQSDAKWAEWSRKQAAAACSYIIRQKLRPAIDYTRWSIKALQIAAGPAKIVSDGLRGFAEVTLDYAVDESLDAILSRFLPEGPEIVVDAVFFLEPPSPPPELDEKAGILLLCYYEDGVAVKLPRCNELNFWDKGIFGNTPCRA